MWQKITYSVVFNVKRHNPVCDFWNNLLEYYLPFSSNMVRTYVIIKYDSRTSSLFTHTTARKSCAFMQWNDQQDYFWRYLSVISVDGFVTVTHMIIWHCNSIMCSEDSKRWRESLLKWCPDVTKSIFGA